MLLYFNTHLVASQFPLKYTPTRTHTHTLRHLRPPPPLKAQHTHTDNIYQRVNQDRFLFRAPLDTRSPK